MLREKLVFGPIFSRRLGSSLGINLLPEEGKLCNFDCIYCECGWNKDGKDDRMLPTPELLEKALKAKLEQCRQEGVEIDSLTFSGDGEPTLNPAFPEMVDLTLKLRDMYYPSAKVTVLSNATRINAPGVFEALRKVDNPVLKLDAPTDEAASYINRPVGRYSVREVVDSLRRFEGNFILQTMFLHSEEYDSAAAGQLEAWMDIVRELRPRQVMVYTLDRPSPEQNLKKYTVEEMTKMVEPLLSQGFEIQIKG